MADGHVRVAAGDTAGARKVLAALKPGPFLAQQAWLMRALGDTTASYEMFARAIVARDGDALWILTSVPTLYSARAEPPYQALFARAGLSPDPVK
jgi:hypothetical protein